MIEFHRDFTMVQWPIGRERKYQMPEARRPETKSRSGGSGRKI